MLFLFERIKRRVKKIKNKHFPSREQRLQKKRTDDIKNKVSRCGNNLTVFGEVEMVCPNKVSIGNNCRLNNHVYINARSSVELGNDVTISYGAKILSTGYDLEHWIDTGEKKHIEDQPVYVGNHCWIGAGAIILPGVRITGEYVVVAAGAVVTRSVSENRVIIAGNPAKIVKWIEV